MSEQNGVISAASPTPNTVATPSASQAQSVPPSAQPQTHSTASASQDPVDKTQTQSLQLPDQPGTSAADSGSAPRPRDARTIHLLLSALGVQAYQDRVPLQLLDFAYRYTYSLLQDAHHLSSEGYLTSHAGTKHHPGDKVELNLNSMRLAASTRLGHQFSQGLSKETLLELAQEKNKQKLPDVNKDVKFGIRLPHERYVQLGTGWEVLEEWDSEEQEEEAVGKTDEQTETRDKLKINGTALHSERNLATASAEGDEDEEMQDEDGFEHVFGADEGEKEDETMANT